MRIFALPQRRERLLLGATALVLSLGVTGTGRAQPVLNNPVPPAVLPQDMAPGGFVTGGVATGDGPVVARPAPLAGRVAEVFSTRFILATGQERLLVEVADSAVDPSLAVGDQVEVEGERLGMVVRATRVARVALATSQPLTVPGPMVTAPGLPQGTPFPMMPEERLPPSSLAAGPRGVTATLQALGLVAIDAPVTKKHHIEVLARMPDGRTVYVSFDRAGRLWEIEDALHDRDASVPRNLTRADYERLAREAGFRPTGMFEEKRRHVEVGVINRAGEALTLHLDRAGVIYKQVWQR